MCFNGKDQRKHTTDEQAVCQANFECVIDEPMRKKEHFS